MKQSRLDKILSYIAWAIIVIWILVIIIVPTEANENTNVSGDNTIIYTTDNKFVYNLDGVPQYDGTGDIRYRGRSVGKIASVALDNLGSDYISMPRIKGVVPAPEYKAEIECIRDILDLNSTAGVNTQSSILIAADYHNFRGTSKRTIGMSQPTSWRATTI